MTSDKELKVLTKVARDILPYPFIGDRFITEHNAEEWAEEIIKYHSVTARNLPDDFVETVKRHAIINLVDSTQGSPLDTALKVLESYHKDQLRNFEKSGEVINVLNKMERVIPLLLRAMETSDDLDLLEASIDLLEVHLAKLSELTK